MSEQQIETTIQARDLLRLRDFRFLWLGQIVSNFGDALTHLCRGNTLHSFVYVVLHFGDGFIDRFTNQGLP